jgi:hypothetical protein
MQVSPKFRPACAAFAWNKNHQSCACPRCHSTSSAASTFSTDFGARSKMGFHYVLSLFLLATAVLAAPLAAEHSSLTECLESHSLPLLIQSSPNYTSAIQPFNLRVPWKPTALVIPSTADQIAQAVQCANKYDVKVAARSGGHSYSANGLGGADGSLVIDMKMFKSVKVDPTTRIATIGTGNRLGDIATKLFAQGKRALPHGLCPGLASLPIRGPAANTVCAVSESVATLCMAGLDTPLECGAQLSTQSSQWNSCSQTGASSMPPKP